MMFSIVIPVYNRPDEMEELLASLKSQTRMGFEVIVVEDGSAITCEEVVRRYEDQLDIKYYTKPNSGPGTTRNYGAERSGGTYLIFMDSDCMAPPRYIEELESELAREEVDVFGGADRANSSFTTIQKAINYSMTSFFTTGGIRGGQHKMDKFYPRTFNMGIKKEAFDTLGGFSTMRFGEDVDLSIRLFRAGYSCRFFSEAWVYHKRRTNLRQFFKQVYNSGIARIMLTKRHPGTLKFVHILPTLVTLGSLCVVLSLPFYPLFTSLLLLYSVIILIDATIQARSIAVGLIAVVTSFTQLIGYGSGFIVGWWRIMVLKQERYTAFDRTFYK